MVSTVFKAEAKSSLINFKADAEAFLNGKAADAASKRATANQ